MDQAKSRKVEKGIAFLRPPKLSREAFKALITERGWRMADLACRWSIRPEHLSRIAADEDRDMTWDDLVRSLPSLSRFEQACVTAARLALIPSKPRRRKRHPADTVVEAVVSATTDSAGQPGRPFNWDHEDNEEDEAFTPGVDGFRYHAYLSRGAELVVVQEIDGFASEQSILLVIATRIGADPAGGAQEEYQCESVTGEQRWFEPDQIDDWLVSNGKTRKLL